MMDNKPLTNKTNNVDENFAKFVLQDHSKSNKRKDIIFLIVIVLLIGFCTFKEFQYQNVVKDYTELLSNIEFEDTTYEVDSEGNGNAVINEGGDVNIGEGKEKS